MDGRVSKHLLHVGYPKAGSTYLQRWFETHPEIAYVDGGIAGFRDVWSMASEVATGSPRPACRVTSAEVLSAPRVDASVAISPARKWPADIVAAQESVADLLASLFAGAQVLIVTRGYRSMIVSSSSQMVRNGATVGLPDLVRGLRDPALPSGAPWHYDRLIRAYQRGFGADNVLVMPWELLRDDVPEFIRHLAARLGVSPAIYDLGIVNPSLSPAEMYWYPRIAKLVRTLRSDRLNHLFAHLSYRNLLRHPIALLAKIRPDAQVTDVVITDELLEPFRGTADVLRTLPLYAPYLRDYLLD